VLAVPRSIPRSLERKGKRPIRYASNMTKNEINQPR
jgi:hypothetical protein